MIALFNRFLYEPNFFIGVVIGLVIAWVLVRLMRTIARLGWEIK